MTKPDSIPVPEATDTQMAADLAELAAGVAEQAQQVAEVEQASQPAPPDLAGEITGLVLAFVGIAKPILPSLGRVYTEETTAAAAGAVAAVCSKHGWLQGGVMGDYGEEVAAAVVLVPLCIATVQGVKGDIAENKRKEEYIRMKKQADLRQHMNIAHNLDGNTKPAPSSAPGRGVTIGTVQAEEAGAAA